MSLFNYKQSCCFILKFNSIEISNGINEQFVKLKMTENEHKINYIYPDRVSLTQNSSLPGTRLDRPFIARVADFPEKGLISVNQIFPVTFLVLFYKGNKLYCSNNYRRHTLYNQHFISVINN